ncbi:uncharacterized protein BYT42DRAFT_612033 [Radiomyces spectabilis]|uniref:uncharacterized protein n=1 Tax=Radiomyces spectabilis TaxID=64574 RepID=UPI00221FB86F|nr:uncharacterized protein BYT42DRAFT_612033 [Radiomyces spectabilis]KAI8384323.1 hypothetical protein BYT42DRAFT_612033 [Radiomyces spectabilis]
MASTICGIKRKRAIKSVQFDLTPCIIETYSSADYDRGGLFAMPVLYKFKLSLDIPAIPPPALTDSEDDGQSSSSATSSPDTERATQLLPKRRPPKLSIDTSICAGPLIFTNLSTNHAKRLEDDESTNDYLVPMSAV